MKTQNIKKLKQVGMVLIALTVVASFAACGKKSDSSGNVANSPVAPDANAIGASPVGGTYLTSAVGNDSPTGSSIGNGGVGSTTVQVELDFFGEGTVSSTYYGRVDAVGFIYLTANPIGCPTLQNAFYNGIRKIPVQSSTGGTMSNTVFTNLILQTVGTSYPFQVQMQGRVRTAIPNLPGAEGKNYSNTLDADLYVSGCYLPILVN